MSVIALVGLPDVSAADSFGAGPAAPGPGSAPARTGAPMQAGPREAPQLVVLRDVATQAPLRPGGTVELRRVPVPSGSAPAAAAALLAAARDDVDGADPLAGGLLVVHALEDEATAAAVRCLRAQHRPTRGGPSRVVGVPLGPTPLAAATAAELLVRVLAGADPDRHGSGLPEGDVVTGPAGLPLLAALLARLAGRLHVAALCPRVGHLAEPAPSLADHVRGWLPGQRFLARRSPQPAVVRLGPDGLRWEHLLGPAPVVARAGGAGRATPERGEAEGPEDGAVGHAGVDHDAPEGWELVVSPDQAVARWALELLELLEPSRADGVVQRRLPHTRRRDDVVRRGGVELVLVPGPATELVAGELAALTPATCGWCRARAVPPSCAACGAGVQATAGSPGRGTPRTVEIGSLAVVS